jgi:predicted Na+-dependent transporter
MPIGTALACAAGFAFPAAGELLGGYLALMVAMLMLMMGAGIGFRRFSSRMSCWREVGFVMALTYLAAPLVGWLLAKLFFSNQPELYTGLILIATTSTTLSTCVIFTRLAGGDEALALWLSVCSSLLATVISPLLLLFLLGDSLQVPVRMLMSRLLLVLFVPLSVGMILRSLLGEQRVAPLGNVLTRSCSLIVLAVIMVAVAKGRHLLTGPGSVKLVFAMTVFHFSRLLLWRAAICLVGFSRPQRIATLFCSVEKTLQIPAYLAISLLGAPAAALAPVVHHVVALVADSLIVTYYSSTGKKVPQNLRGNGNIKP